MIKKVSNFLIKRMKRLLKNNFLTLKIEPLLLGVLIALITFFNFIISPGTLIYLDCTPWLYPEKYILAKFMFNTWGAIVLANIPFLLLYLIPISKIIGVFNAWELFWIVAFALGSYFIYKTFKDYDYPYWYIASLILLFNPFIYLRITAGQMGMVLSTVLSPLYLYFLFKYYETGSNKLAFILAIAFTFSSMFQPHYFILNGMIFMLYSIILLLKRETNVESVLKALLFIILVNSYWLCFLFTLKPIMLKAVTKEHLEFFYPKPSININTATKLVGLYGFWREIAVKRFYVEYPVVFYFVVFSLIYFTILGYIINPKDSKNILFLILFFIGIILALITPYLSFIQIMKSFRDSHKFLYFTLLSYVFLIPKGLREFKKTRKNIILLTFTIIWVFYNHYQILLWNQLKPIRYPSDYLNANRIVSKLGGKVIYLPWGVYFTYNWSLKAGLDGRIANPANAVFEKFIITGCNPKSDFCYETPLQQKIRKCLEENDPKCLQKLGIKYVIYDKSAIVNYPDICRGTCDAIYNNNLLVVYSIE